MKASSSQTFSQTCFLLILLHLSKWLCYVSIHSRQILSIGFVFCLVPHTSWNPFGQIFKIYTESNSLFTLPQLPTLPTVYHPLVPEQYNSLLSPLLLPFLCFRIIFKLTEWFVWMHESDNVTTQFKTLKWLCISFREKPKSEWPMSPFMMCPTNFLISPPNFSLSPLLCLDTLVFSQYLDYDRMLLPCSEQFIYGSSACISLSSDILIAPSYFLQLCSTVPFAIRSFATTTF